ncbi:YceI family protein [Luteimonas pelagia]
MAPSNTARSASRLRARIAAALVLLTGASAPCLAEPARYTLDPVHTRVLAVIEHGGYSMAMGTVSGSEGTLVFDPDDWRQSRIEASVPLSRLDFGDAGWNAAVGRMLGTDVHPFARFVAGPGGATVDAAGARRLCGELTLHGVTRPLCMDVQANRVARHSVPPFRLVAGFSATASLRRSDFGIVDWPRMVGDEVALRIEVEARHAGPAPDGDTVAPDGDAAQDGPVDGETPG